MTTLYFDIETIPTDLPWVIEDLRANIRPPSNYSKPETIEKWMAENAESAFEEKLHATGLDGAYGQICCIAYAFDDESIQTIGTHLQLTERSILADFAAELKDKRFNPQPRVAADMPVRHCVDTDKKFQSTAARGG